ncbi:hypothetical protein LA5095_00880 [Roseibium album]|nr:hypothetical protein LA5095_00880 [Roseibium album]
MPAEQALFAWFRSGPVPDPSASARPAPRFARQWPEIQVLPVAGPAHWPVAPVRPAGLAGLVGLVGLVGLEWNLKQLERFEPVPRSAAFEGYPRLHFLAALQRFRVAEPSGAGVGAGSEVAAGAVAAVDLEAATDFEAAAENQAAERVEVGPEVSPERRCRQDLEGEQS